MTYNRALMTKSPPYFNLCDYFLGEDRLREIGDRVAIEYRDRSIRYSELRNEVDHWKRRILDCGAKQGDRVALLLYDSPDWIAGFLAVVSIGAICVPVNTFIPADDLAFILRDSASRIVITEDELRLKIDQCGVEPEGRCQILSVEANRWSGSQSEEIPAGEMAGIATTRESPAFLLYTSGSTGKPKGVIHRQGAIPCTVKSYSENILNLTPEDICYSASRLFFAYGLGNSLSFPLAAGATVILDRERPSPQRLSSLFQQRRPDVFFGVPAIYRSLLEYENEGGQLDLSSLRLCISAGEALPESIFTDWERLYGSKILDGIGSTEMLHIFISNREGSARAGSSGQLVPSYEAHLLDDVGRECNPGESGHLWVRGASGTTGYWNQPELTAETIQEGWVRTGDVYRRDEDGFYFHVGRSDDCFKVNGLWVSPVEVETELLRHESVVEAAVIASIGDSGLATAKAFVVIRQDGAREALESILLEFLSSRLPHYKVPSQIEFLKELPRTSTGKIQRYMLRAESQRNPSGGSNDH